MVKRAGRVRIWWHDQILVEAELFIACHFKHAAGYYYYYYYYYL
jgi:hypothetical protein